MRKANFRSSCSIVSKVNTSLVLWDLHSRGGIGIEAASNFCECRKLTRAESPVGVQFFRTPNPQINPDKRQPSEILS